MGMYTYLSTSDFKNYSKVSDKDTDEIFQDVRKLMPDVYIAEHHNITERLFRKDLVHISYSVYHRIDKGEITGTEEVQQLNLHFLTKTQLDNYLYGLFNGYKQGAKQKQSWQLNKSPKKK